MRSAHDMDELIHMIKSRRYSHAKVSRLLLQMVLGMDRRVIGDLTSSGPSYAKVLAFNETGAQALKAVKACGSLDVISNVNRFSSANQQVIDSLALDIKAADVYNILVGRDLYRYSDRVCVPKVTDLG